MTANAALGVGGAFVLASGVLGLNEVWQLNFFLVPGQTPICEGSLLHVLVNIGLIVVGGAIIAHEVIEAVKKA